MDDAICQGYPAYDWGQPALAVGQRWQREGQCPNSAVLTQRFLHGLGR
jgi:hypothetical protein